MTTQTIENYETDGREMFKGYSLFVEVEDKVLQAFNRWNVLSNMTQNDMSHIGLEYIAKLDGTDRLRLALMSEYIKRVGLEETKREIVARTA